MDKILQKTKKNLTILKRIGMIGLTFMLVMTSALILSSSKGKNPEVLVTVNAGDDIYLNCTHEPFTSIALNGSANGHLYVMWETTGDGYFYDPTALNTEYYFGSEDLESEAVTLTLTAYGNYGTSASDNLKIFFPKQLIKMEPIKIYLESVNGYSSIWDTTFYYPPILGDTTIYDTIWNWVRYDSIEYNTMAVSSFYDFSDKTIGQVLAPLGDLVYDVHDANGPVDLNNLWNSRTAYRLKVKDTCCLGIYSGEPVFNRQFVFEPGVKYFLPVLTEDTVNLTDIFGDAIGEPIEYLFRIDDFMGNTTYPQFDSVTGMLNEDLLFIKQLIPGRGYEVMVSQTIEIEFPGHIDLQCPEDFTVERGDTILLTGGQPNNITNWYSGPGVFTNNGSFYFNANTPATLFGSFPVKYSVEHPVTGTVGSCTFHVNVGMLCASDTTVGIGDVLTLNKAFPEGGIYSGNGVSLINGHYVFNSISTGYGLHEIGYTFTDSTGNTGNCNFNIKVLPIPFQYKDTVVCFNERTYLNFIQPPGGVFEGEYIGQDENGYYFEAEVDVYGIFPITYHYTNQFGVAGNCTFNINVQKSDFFVGFIPDLSVWHNDTLTFEVKDCGNLLTEYSIIPPDTLDGYINIDPQEGIFTYIPAITDKREFEVTVIAQNTYGSNEQVVEILPKPLLPPEEDVIFYNNGKKSMPDESEFVIHTFRSDSTQFFNTTTREVFVHTLVGKTIILEAGNEDYPFYDNYLSYNPATGFNANVKQLDIYAESLIIRDELWMPQTNINIKARYLIFEDKAGATPARIKTEPLSKTEQPEFVIPVIDGVDGHNAGNITIITDSIVIPGNRIRFITNGGNGQTGGKGKKGEKTGTDLIPVGNNTNTTCGDLSSYLNNHPLSRFWRDKAVVLSIHYRYGENFLGYMHDCKQKYWAGNWSGGWYNYNQAPTPNWEAMRGDGTDAIAGGMPGAAGNAGNLYANKNLSSYYEALRGKAGNSAGYYSGGPPSSPQYAWHVNFDMWSHDPPRIDENGQPKSDSTYYGNPVLSPIRVPSHGQNGQFVLDNDDSWINPYTLDQILSYCKNGYRYHDLLQTRNILFEYVNICEAYLAEHLWVSNDDIEIMEVNQIYQEMLQMLQSIDSNLDYFGNPFGWVPMLSFETHYLAYEREINRAVDQVYLSRWLLNMAEGQVEKKAALEQIATEIKYEIDSVLTFQYSRIKDDILDIESEVQNIDLKTTGLIQQLESRQAYLYSLSQNKHKKAFWRRALGILGPILQVFPVGQPYVGIVGTAMTFVGNVDIDDPLGTLSQIPSLISQFQNTMNYADDLDIFFDKADNFFSYAQNMPLSELTATNSIFWKHLDTLASNTKPVYQNLSNLTKIIKQNEAPKNKIQEELERLKANDSTFIDLTEQIEQILEDKEVLGRKLVQSMRTVQEIQNSVTRNFLMINRLNMEYNNEYGGEYLYPRTKQFLKTMEERALGRLDKYYYYFTKAFEYRFLKPYDSYDIITLFKDATDYVMANSNEPQGEQFKYLKGFFKSELDEVNSFIIDTITTGGYMEYESTLEYDFTQAQLNQLNQNDTLVINLVEDGEFLMDKSNIKLIDVFIDPTGTSVMSKGQGTKDTYYSQIKVQHSGVSKFISTEGELMLFKHYNKQFEGFGNAYSGYNWRSTFYPTSGNAYDDDPSSATESLLVKLLDADENTTFYERPSAFSDLRITKIDQCNGCDEIVFDNLRLIIQYSYFENPNADRSFKSIAIRPNNKSLNPYFILDKEDKNGRQDGRGNFFRFYNSSTTKLNVSAPENYGNYIFQYWLKNTEGKNMDTVKNSTIQVTLNNNYELVSCYERLQPKLSVSPDTITESFESGIDTIHIKNIGTGEMEWFTENENEWITILNNKVGVNDYDLTFTVSTNNSDTTRTGKIFVYANESLNFVDSVMIIQPPSEYMVSYSLPQGWAGISSWLDPVQQDAEDIFSQVSGDLIILQNLESVYWPEQGVNTIQDWNINSGYMIKMKNARQMAFPGIPLVNSSLFVNSGWKLIPVLTDCNVQTSALFQNANLKIVKEVAGTNLYWPEYGINTLPYLDPGKSYFVYLNDTATLHYGSCKQFKTSVDVENHFDGTTPWNVVCTHPVSHVFALAIHNSELNLLGHGNTIGIFNSNKKCCGHLIIGEGNTLVAFADDHMTSESDGLSNGEAFSLRLYDKESRLNYKLLATYDVNLPEHHGVFANHGLSAITNLKVGELIIDELSLRSIEIFPNPVKDILYINNPLPVLIQYSFKDLKGNAVFEGNLYEGNNQISTGNWQKGVYLMTVKWNEQSITHRIIKN